MQNCFGFDDEDDMDGDHDEAEVPGKETIKLVDAITN